MRTDDHSETAFPVQIGQTCNDLRGMSLRDYLAGQALTGILAKPNSCWTIGETVGFAYRYADAMLTERGKENGT